VVGQYHYCGRHRVCRLEVLDLPKIVAAVMALAALGAAILAGVDPVQIMVRGVIAFGAGWVVGSIWEGLVQATSRIRVVSSPAGTESPEAEERQAA
jgi:hypothetical protein